MKTDHIENARVVGGDYFRLIYVRKSNKTLQSYLDKFNPSDYHIVKCSSRQKVVSYEEMLEFKYSGYIFFLKELYDVNDILEWMSKDFNPQQSFCYLVKPTPPFSYNKVIIKQ